jgi:multidrug efflux pump subunit AcrA (membrane-fusion protein)
MKTNTSKSSRKNGWFRPSLVVLIAVVGGAGYYYFNDLRTTENTENQISTSTASTGDIVLSATGSGTLTPSEDVSFGFENRGKVSEVLVALGDDVKAGQILARQESTTLALEYKQAEANLAALSSPSAIASAEQAVEDAKLSFDNARDDLRYLIGPDMLLAEENVANAQARLNTATAVAEKDPSDGNKQLVEETKLSLTKAQEALNYIYYAYSSNYILQTFTYPVRNDNGVTLRKGLDAPTDAEILAARAAYDLAKATLNDAQNYLDILQGDKTTEGMPPSSITSITDATITFDQAKANLDATELIAPIDGTITSISLNAGDMADSSSAVAISNMTQSYMVDAYLDETDWGKVRVGYEVLVTFDLLPDSSYSGKIIKVYPGLDSSSGTSLIHIVVQLANNINVDLPAGATASVDVTGGKALDAVLVPTSALKEVEPGKYIVYLMKDGEPIQQEVEIGIQDILNAEVKSGLQPGDVVLTNATDMSE